MLVKLLCGKDSNTTLAESLVHFETRIAAGRPRAKRNKSPIPPKLLSGYQREFEQREFEKRHRLNTSDGAAEAHVDDAIVARKSKDTESYYLSLFLNDLSDSLADSTPVAYLGSSTTTDLLTLMHNRTGHCNVRTLIECHKSKLVRDLKI